MVFSLSRNDLFDALFRLSARQHHLMAAALATQAKIHANPQNKPLPAATGMLFFHFQQISNLNIQTLRLPQVLVSFDLIPIALCRLFGLIITILVILPPYKGIRQILLLCVMIWKIVGILVG